jgi:hypothetical protein
MQLEALVQAGENLEDNGGTPVNAGDRGQTEYVRLWRRKSLLSSEIGQTGARW